MDYNVGDEITYRPFLGGERTGVVLLKDPDIKNGKPGFDMKTPDGFTNWGYDEQIISVQRREGSQTG